MRKLRYSTEELIDLPKVIETENNGANFQNQGSGLTVCALNHWLCSEEASHVWERSPS